ncbi:hypothetical protein [Lentzea flaviverrucosa]|uniref:hypothetical protein n=1 Tax=Lentzea flaviverrucosa TaxID=200379 RepID=UPI001160D91E|nr:hypothetical protein [Lentzea flaviverrucosa]
MVLGEKRTGGAGIGSSPVSLVILTLRPGVEDEVARTQIDAAVAVGYVRPPTPPCGKGQSCSFHGQPDLPMLTIETYSPGERFSFFQPVPDGHTGVIVSLSQHASARRRSGVAFGVATTGEVTTPTVRLRRKDFDAALLDLLCDAVLTGHEARR